MPSKSKSINHAFAGDLGYFMHHRAKVHNALGLCSVLGTFTVSNSARFLTFTMCLIRCRSTAGWVGLALSRNFVSYPSYKYERMEFILLHPPKDSSSVFQGFLSIWRFVASPKDVEIILGCVEDHRGQS